MASITSELKQSFRDNDIVIKLIYVNAAVFLVMRLMDIVALGGSQAPGWFVRWMGMPIGSDLIVRPWTLATNIFSHYDFIHFIFNMLCLYWFGRIFMQTYQSERRALITYVVGGLAGCFVALTLAFSGANHILLGASGAVMALLLATTTATPDRRVWVTFFGDVKMKWVALAYVGISVLMLIGLSNVGGNLAHLGGALAGWLLARRWAKHAEKDSSLSSLFGKRRSKLKATTGGLYDTNPDWEYNKRHTDMNAELDRILDKIKQRGYDSLTAEEKKKLFDISNK